MKLGICAIAKGENDYIEEWINHYVNVIGVDTVFLYDNNEDSYENVESRIVKNKSKVVVCKWGSTNNWNKTQTMAYNDCWKRYHDKYDWIGFFDIDEFLVLDEGVNLSSLLSSHPYAESESVRVTWHMYNDNDLIYRDITIPVMESFTQSNDFWVASKSIHNCNVSPIDKHIHVHGDDGKNGKMVDICGMQCFSGVEQTEFVTTYHYIPGGPQPQLSVGKLNHYRSKSLQEFIQKVKQSYNRGQFHDSDKIINYYFQTPNRITNEKLELLFQNGFIPSENLKEHLYNRMNNESWPYKTRFY